MKEVKILFIPCNEQGNFDQKEAIQKLLDHHNELVKRFNELLKSIKPSVAFPQDD